MIRVTLNFALSTRQHGRTPNVLKAVAHPWLWKMRDRKVKDQTSRLEKNTRAGRKAVTLIYSITLTAVDETRVKTADR